MCCAAKDVNFSWWGGDCFDVDLHTLGHCQAFVIVGLTAEDGCLCQTRYGEDRWGPFRFLIHTAAILNPEDIDGLRWAHSVAGEVEGCVSGDIHTLGLLNKVRKSLNFDVYGIRYNLFVVHLHLTDIRPIV